jgi:hypothetical protein
MEEAQWIYIFMLSSEVAYNDTRGHRQFKATRPERKEKKKGVALLP